MRKYTPHRGKAGSSTDQSSGLPGGEDVSAVQGVLKDALEQWNSTLPPFDVDFYTTVCCDPAFEKQYSDVQDISMKLHENPKDVSTMNEWKQKLESKYGSEGVGV